MKVRGGESSLETGTSHTLVSSELTLLLPSRLNLKGGGAVTRFEALLASSLAPLVEPTDPALKLRDLMLLKRMLSPQRHYLQTGVFAKVYACLLSTRCLLSTYSGPNAYRVPDPVWVGCGTAPLRAPLSCSRADDTRPQKKTDEAGV